VKSCADFLFLKILIRGLILLAALIINVYAQRLRERTAE
jgi:ribose transport system permease protein